MASLNSFNVTLSWGPLVNIENESDKITFLINDKSSDSDYVFYAFDPSSGVMADDRVHLEFATADYKNAEHKGTYSTTVTMTIIGDL